MLIRSRTDIHKATSTSKFRRACGQYRRLRQPSFDRAVGKDFGGESYLNAPNRWEWRLGHDLKTSVEYARDYVPVDVDGLKPPATF
jgi:hypothetical protein